MSEHSGQPPEQAPPSDALAMSWRDDLRDGLNELAEIVSDAHSLADLLSEVAAAAVVAIPGADGAGVTLLRVDTPMNRVQALGASHAFVGAIDAIQYEAVDEGPCISAALERVPVRSGSVGSDPRWPRFGARVGRLGVHSVLALPMQLRSGEIVGAINVYSRARDAFDDHGAQVGMMFARPAGVAVHNAQLLEVAQARAEQLQTAMVTRAVIDQAIGIIRARSGTDAPQAFERLRTISQNENVKLSVVAERIVDEAVRRARAHPGDS